MGFPVVCASIETGSMKVLSATEAMSAATPALACLNIKV